MTKRANVIRKREQLAAKLQRAIVRAERLRERLIYLDDATRGAEAKVARIYAEIDALPKIAEADGLSGVSAPPFPPREEPRSRARRHARVDVTTNRLGALADTNDHGESKHPYGRQ